MGFDACRGEQDSSLRWTARDVEFLGVRHEERVVITLADLLTFRTQKTLDFMQFSPLVSIIGKYTVRYNSYHNRVLIV